MPKIKSIHDPYYQMKEFFYDESTTRVTPKNPYNILWIIQELFENKLYINVQKDCLEAIKNNKNIDTITLPKDLKPLLLEDNIVLKRIKNLIDINHVNIDSISAKVVRFGTSELIKGLFELGMSPNYINDINQCGLMVAINRKKPAIFDLYLEHPDIDLEFKDQDGNNILAIAIEKKMWSIAEKLTVKKPELILELNSKNENILDIINKIKILSKTPTKNHSDNFNKLCDSIIKVMFENKIQLIPSNYEEHIRNKIITSNHQAINLKIKENYENKNIKVKI